MDAQRAFAPVLSGSVPPAAIGFFARQETGFGLADGLRPGTTVLLVPAAGSDPGGGMTAAGATVGTGKTQLAVGFAHSMWSSRAVDLLVWVPAVNRTAIVAGYARAATDLEIDEPGESADAAARRFLSWLRATRRRWAVVLDGVRSPVDVDGLWPEGDAGQVVVTSRLREAELGGPGRTAYGVPGFSRREALGYLNSRLTSFPDQRIEALDLAEDVGGLPIAMAQAASVIMLAESTCRDYRGEYAERLRGTAGTLVDGCPQSLLATWSLAVERAHELPPAGLAWSALVFAACLDTSGIPAAVLTAPAACAYITGRPATGAGSEQNLVRAAFGNLERLGLISVDAASSVRTIWLHSAVRAAVRAYLAPGTIEQAVDAAAAALTEAWPGPGQDAATSGSRLTQALRDCAAALQSLAGELLWKPDAHPVLIQAGLSLGTPPALAESAIGYWQSMAATCTRLLGHGHAQTVLSRDRLAAGYATAGRLAEALTVFEAALADRARELGPEHPDTLAARVNVARSLEATGRQAEAIGLFEQVLAMCERLFGAGSQETLETRGQLAAAYSAAGRRGDSIRMYEMALAGAERDLGPGHPVTLGAQASLAAAYQAAGQLREAIAGFQRAIADRELASGPEHLETIATRASLANAYRVAGRAKEATAEYERVLADRERLQGADHLDTVTARGNLAFAYRSGGRLKDAISQYERTLADRERLQGADHRDTLTARANLAAAYQLARRLREAISGYERALADSERMLGPGDTETLTVRCNLATAYNAAGRMADGAKVLRRALADCERYLGPDHPMTGTVRENLQATE
jgi:tetratricopeptide (TPR) repeat protein